MTEVNACTVITRNRVAHGRVLADSFHDHHPDGTLTALLVDDVDRQVTGERFEVIHPEDAGLDRRELHRMATMYDALQLAGALKPLAMQHCLEHGAGAILYLDSDILVGGSLVGTVELAEEHGLVLTPHLLRAPHPETDQERPFLVEGVFNSGCLVASTEGLPFLDWWRQRLARDCAFHAEAGQYGDQTWLNLVPAYFDYTLLRDPGVNLGVWGLVDRLVEKRAGGYAVDGELVRAFHFARFDPKRPYLLTPFMTVRLSQHPALADLCRFYAARLLECGYESCLELEYGFGLGEGLGAERIVRDVYAAALLKAEVEHTPEPPNPFGDGTDVFRDWLNQPDTRGDAESGLSRYRKAARVAGVEASDDSLEVTRSASAAPSGPREGPQRSNELRPGVNMVLRSGGTRPVDEVGRVLLDCLSEMGIDVGITLWHQEAERDEAVFEGVDPRAAMYDVNLICLNPLDLVGFAFYVDAEFFHRRPSIGVWLDEDVPTPDLQHSVGFLDEIWVGSDYAARELRERVRTHVQTLPIPVSQPTLSGSQPDLPAGRFVMALADLGDDLRAERSLRENAVASIRAFKHAFPPEEGPTLLVRVTGGEAHPVALEELLFEADRADVAIIEGPLEPEERHALIAACECAISLHRVTDFDLFLAEALAAAKPVVATGFSGNLAYMDEDSAFLVRYSTFAISPAATTSWLDGVWAEPDMHEAGYFLRQIWEDPVRAQGRAQRGQATLLSRHGKHHTSAFVAASLAELRLRGSREANAPDPSPSDQPFALQRVTSFMTDGPVNRWNSPSRLGTAGRLARRLLFRAIRPYAIRQQELDSAMVEALSELNHRLAQLSVQVKELEERLLAPERPRDDASRR